MRRSATLAPVPRRTVKTRRIAIDYPHGSAMPRHYVNHNIVMSHIVTNLSCMFPEGEDFFVRSVRNYRDQVTDPELKKQVAGFIGQEAMHGREHRNFNDGLGALGFPARLIDRCTKHGLALLARVTPKSHQLAVTAALEHYTATLAEKILSDEDARSILRTVPEVEALFSWHALEESEHKSVAFDVYQHCCGNYGRRVIVMQATTVGFLLGIVASTVASLAIDPATYRHPVRLLREVAALRRSPFVGKDVIAHLWSYNARSFHPDDRDTSFLTDQWRNDLFGAEGTMRDLILTGESAPTIGSPEAN
jgi:predicted metal-dependent hydrolase